MSEYTWLLFLLVAALVVTMPTVESLATKGQYTDEPTVPISMAGSWSSPWLQPTSVDTGANSPRPFSDESDCAKVAGTLAAADCYAGKNRIA
jgi:hypothetical protein